MGQVINNQISGGLGITKPSTDGVSALIFQTPAAATGALYTLGTVYKLQSVQEASALGLDEAFDIANSIQVFQPIKEFFRANPKGTLHILGVLNTGTWAAMFTTATVTNALKIINEAQGEVKQIAAAFNPAVAPSAGDLEAAIAAAQSFAIYCRDNNRPLHVFLENYGAVDVDLLVLNASKVSVFAGQNDGYYALGAWAQNHSAIGMCLGVVSAASVNENVGWIGKFNLKAGEFNKARLDGAYVDQVLPSVITNKAAKGYMFFVAHTDYAGLYINDSYTCTVATDDYSTVEVNRTWNKAARLIRQAMLPYINSPVEIDTTTGFIASATVAAMESAGNKAIKQMFQAGEISGPDPQGPTPPFQIDPEQDVIATSEIITQLSIVPTGTARTITNNIGFKNPQNS